MRIALIQFPGSTSARETALAVARAGMEPISFLWNDPLENLAHFSGYILVGGFSYEDRARAGVIAAKSPILHVLKKQSEAGKPILGICNGAQILVEAGLVPGLRGYQLGMALTENKPTRNGKRLPSRGFYNATVLTRFNHKHQSTAFTRLISQTDIIPLVVAHREGRFVIPEPLLEEIKYHGLIALQYCDQAGDIKDEFPINPNGSVYNIAALANKAGNVMAMMPHPERSSQGDLIFQSMRDYMIAGVTPSQSQLRFTPPPYQVTHYKAPRSTRTLIVSLRIMDNHALTVERTLQQQGISVTIKRYVHWEIESTLDAFEKIQRGGLLFNENKEQAFSGELERKSCTFLVRSKDDEHGQLKKQQLERHHGIAGIKAIRQGILWQVTGHEGNREHLINQLVNSSLFFNPFVHDCYTL